MPRKKLTEQEKFERLKAKWYKKLKQTGFEDIEKDESHLKRSSQSYHKDMNRIGYDWRSRAQYFQMATNFLNEYRFVDDFEKNIWMYHSEGLTVVNISEILKKVYKKKRASGRDVVDRAIQRLRKSMFSLYLFPSKAYHE